MSIAATLPGFFSIPPLDRDESRFAQATAQMLETGDFIRIRLQDEARNKKPVGVYWLQAASVATFSDVAKREIWAWRLPSMLGAVIATLATFWGGIALVGRRSAFVGAALLAACALLSTEGMIAKTDAMLCGMTALAMAALARIFMRVGGGRTAIVFWAALGCGVLVKGPITPMVAGLAIVTLCAWTRDLHRFRPLLSWIGIALGALIVMPWLIAIDVITEGGFLFDSVVGDMAPKIAGGGEHGSRPPGLHLLMLPILIFPASIGLAPAFAGALSAIRAPREEASHDGVRFLIAWATPTWLVFEIATTKLAHYTLPLYPAIALLAGAGLLRQIDSGRRAGLLVWFAFGGAGLAAIFAYAATWGSGGGDVLSRAWPVAFACGSVLALALAAIALARKPTAIVWTALAAALGLLFIGREIVAPRADHVLVSRAATRALDAAGLSHGAAPLLVVGYREPSLVFAEGTDTRLLQGFEAGDTATAGQAVLLESRERALFEIALRARRLIFTPLGAPVSGQNYSNGDDVALQPGRVTASNDARN